MIVVLMGYMGCGKSTIGKELAKVLNYNFIDLDDYITSREKLTVSKIFEENGEIYFRKKESYYLNEILDSNKNSVLALGGGTPCYGKNLQTLINHSNVSTFYLKVSIPMLTERLFKEREKRPLISHLETKEELLEFIGKHLFERVYYYNQSQFIVSVHNNSTQDVVEDILVKLI